MQEQSIPEEIMTHTAWLEQVTAETLASVAILETEIAAIERGLHRFLESYYGEVGHYVKDLRRVRRGLTRATHGEMAAVDEENEAGPQIRQRAIKEEKARQLYRKLAKLCHPDTSQLPRAGDIFAQASIAYRKGDLCSLILLEQSLMEQTQYAGENPVQKLERMEAKYHLAVREKNKLLSKKHRLKFSAAYQLWQRVCREEARGRDLVGEIKRTILRELRRHSDENELANA